MTLARPLALAAALLLAAAAAPPREAAAAPSAAELAKDRATIAERAFRTSLALYQVGRVSADAVCAWSVRWLDAALEAAPRGAKQALADHAKRMADLEAAAGKAAAAGRVSSLDVDTAAYFHTEAELWVIRGKR